MNNSIITIEEFNKLVKAWQDLATKLIVQDGGLYLDPMLGITTNQTIFTTLEIVFTNREDLPIVTNWLLDKLRTDKEYFIYITIEDDKAIKMLTHDSLNGDTEYVCLIKRNKDGSIVVPNNQWLKKD